MSRWYNNGRSWGSGNLDIRRRRWYYLSHGVFIDLIYIWVSINIFITIAVVLNCTPKKLTLEQVIDDHYYYYLLQVKIIGFFCYKTVGFLYFSQEYLQYIFFVPLVLASWLFISLLWTEMATGWRRMCELIGWANSQWMKFRRTPLFVSDYEAFTS